MKIRILKGTTLHGKAVAEGEILEVSEGDYNNLREYKLAELVDPPKPAKTTDRNAPAAVTRAPERASHKGPAHDELEEAPKFPKDHGKPSKK